MRSVPENNPPRYFKIQVILFLFMCVACLSWLRGTPRGDAANALERRDLDNDGDGDGAGGVRRPPELREGHRRHHGGRGSRVQAGSKKSVNSERGNKKRTTFLLRKMNTTIQVPG